MGEAKRRRELFDEVATKLGQTLTDQGKLLEAGFVIFAAAVIPKDAPPEQRADMRLAFMAGAEHIFSSMISIMDPGEEPTEADMRRMELIWKELEALRGEISERVQPSRGRA